MTLRSGIVLFGLICFQVGCNGSKNDTISAFPHQNQQQGAGQTNSANLEKLIEQKAPAADIIKVKYQSAALVCHLWSLKDTNIYNVSSPSDSISIDLAGPATQTQRLSASIGEHYWVQVEIKIKSIDFVKSKEVHSEDKIYELRNSPVVRVLSRLNDGFQKGKTELQGEFEEVVFEGIETDILRSTSADRNHLYENFVQCTLISHPKDGYGGDVQVSKIMPEIF